MDSVKRVAATVSILLRNRPPPWRSPWPAASATRLRKNVMSVTPGRVSSRRNAPARATALEALNFITKLVFISLYFLFLQPQCSLVGLL
ncbi:hypothetical protein [Hyphococcus sp.]|uniref:hypothetical protein n=1 Tax=Hyphococcus sp. TaxID=2038636 RepID=UPI0035C727B7